MNQSLASLGFTPHFSQQLSLEDLELRQAVRVMQVQRSHLLVSDGEQSWSVPLTSQVFELESQHRPTVGDWILLSGERLERVLERKSVFKRVAAGTKAELQLIAANVDTLFIVTSCNDDFNESRLERYLALAAEAGVDPVVVITKADLAPSTDDYRDRAGRLQPGLPVVVINALDVASVELIQAWINPGSTVALAGSSGVGKSSIVNMLAGQSVTATAAIREQDSAGRHTTTYRSLHLLDSGGLLLDVPGMRELKVAGLDDALDTVFSEIESLMQRCKFSDCAHGKEPGCAVRAALESGELTQRRWQNYQKLLAEESRNNASLAERRQADRAFGKMVRQHMQHKHRDR